ncbi:hypothetical protein [Marinagarivorans cellulosilyticus]|uniref:Uncharacterized protein n=1 Tax=Marinagarivorans cellulosilyticus TaxID=2721545 RepID=A0AAN2BMC6_9GAMM|nr:hypothetical protein [Marinagarivorans cellulosilyticus]BCD99915.1 hypothetical protein MARGE09_P4117 [Marinagarivorans cellulosilyticus]
MKKIWLPLFTAFLSTVYSSAYAEKSDHSIAIALGQLDFSWKEFDINDDFFDPTYVEVVDESGDLNTIHLTYTYEKEDHHFSTQLSRSSGSVNYYGRIIRDTAEDLWDYSTTDYDMTTLEASYGKYFDVDYIKPFAAILGGYTERERTINGNPNFITPYPTGNEDMSFYYWGLLLDVELFSWNNLSLNVGAEYNRGVKTKQTVSSEGEEDYTLKLKPLISRKLLTSLHYSFLNDWKASLLLELTKSTMKKSREEKPYQPDSEEDHSYLGLRLQKTF